jgi:hypothetical protein
MMNVDFSIVLIQMFDKACQEILGERNLSIDTNDASGMDVTNRIDTLFADNGELEKKFGRRGALGILTHIGESSLRLYMRSAAGRNFFSASEFKFLNSKKRNQVGLGNIAEFLTNNSPWQINVINNSTEWVWQIAAENVQSLPNEMWGAFFIGFIKEFLSWSSGGRFFGMNSQVIHNPPENIFQISIKKEPLGN